MRLVSLLLWVFLLCHWRSQNKSAEETKHGKEGLSRTLTCLVPALSVAIEAVEQPSLTPTLPLTHTAMQCSAELTSSSLPPPSITPPLTPPLTQPQPHTASAAAAVVTPRWAVEQHGVIWGTDARGHHTPAPHRLQLGIEVQVHLPANPRQPAKINLPQQSADGRKPFANPRQVPHAQGVQGRAV